MSDLIERQAAIDALERTKEKDPKGDIASFYNTITDNKIAVIEALPSVQPEIIRCKDCKYYTPVTARCEVRGKGLYLIRGLEDYCSRAERREDG